MQKIKFYKTIVISILVIGIILRISLFYDNPPNNSFDDHLQAIDIYSIAFKQPLPSQCWECYQPPVYYYIGAAIFKMTTAINISSITAWKFVQFFNSLLSVLVLFFYYKILYRFRISEINRILYMSFISILPLDILTSSMIGNDYLLVFSAVASFFYFLKCVDDINDKSKVSIVNFIYLSIFVVIGGLTKQHGLILIMFPTIIILMLIVKRPKIKQYIFFPIYILILVLSLSNEFWKYEQTGKFLVSNQDFYNYAEGQFPGSIQKVEFSSFRIISLFQTPFISNQTSASFPTELFARTFFDYEWRFLSPTIPIANNVGRIAYILGLFWISFFIYSTFTCYQQRRLLKFKVRINNILYYTPLIVVVFFFLVPFIQTLRYPYFSSMKSTFALPGIIILLLTHAFFIRKIKLSDSLLIFLTISNLSFGVFFIYSIHSILPISIHHLSGPLWPIP